MPNVVRRLFPDGEFGRAALTLAGGTAIGHVLVVAASPILSRIYSPADFGALAVFAAIVQILSVAGTFRYELAVPLPEDDLDAANLVLAGAVGTVLVTVLLALLAPLLSAGADAVSSLAPLSGYVLLLPLTLLVLGLYEMAEAWVIRRRTFARLVQRTLSQTIAQVSSQIALGAARVRPLGLLVGPAFGYAAGTGWIAARLTPEERALFRRTSLPGALAVARRYKRFPLYSSWSGLINSAGLAVPVLLLATLYGATVAGWFALSTRVVGAPMSLFGTAVSQVYLADASRLVRTDRPRLRTTFDATSRSMFRIAVVPLTALAVAGPWAFTLVFGDEWSRAGQYSRVLAPMLVIQLMVVPVSQTLNVLERQHVQLAWDVARLLVVSLSIVVADRAGWSGTTAVLAYSVSMSAAYLALYALTRRALGTAL